MKGILKLKDTTVLLRQLDLILRKLIKKAILKLKMKQFHQKVKVLKKTVQQNRHNLIIKKRLVLKDKMNLIWRNKNKKNSQLIINKPNNNKKNASKLTQTTLLNYPWQSMRCFSHTRKNNL